MSTPRYFVLGNFEGMVGGTFGVKRTVLMTGCPDQMSAIRAKLLVDGEADAIEAMDALLAGRSDAVAVKHRSAEMVEGRWTAKVELTRNERLFLLKLVDRAAQAAHDEDDGQVDFQNLVQRLKWSTVHDSVDLDIESLELDDAR